MDIRRIGLVAGIALSSTMLSPAALAQDVSYETLQLQKGMITLDTHLDTPEAMDRPGWSIMDRHDVRGDGTQVDYPRMVQGELDGGWWVIYTSQDPEGEWDFKRVRNFAVMRGLTIRNMIAAHPDQFELALTADDAARIKAEGKRVSYMSIENSYPLGEDVTMLDLFYKMGVRMLGFAHFRNNQFADSSTDPTGPKYGGLSPLGFDLLKRANSLGLIIDASHSSDDVLDDLLENSTTPVILSHSGSKAVFDHPRNVDDARMKKVAAKGGVIQVNSYAGYLRSVKPSPQRDAAMKALRGEMGSPDDMDRATYETYLGKLRAINAKYPLLDRPDEGDFFKHLFHILDLVGPDHVGIGMDWDGGGGVTGLEDITDLPVITQALLDHGYSKEDIAKIWGGNILRVMREVEAKADPKTAD